MNVEEEPTLDYCEKLYFHELEAREYLSSRVNIPLAVLISVAGFLGYLIQNIDQSVRGCAVIGVWLFLSLSSVCLVAAAWLLNGGAGGYKYQFVASPAGWSENFKGWYAYHVDAQHRIEEANRSVRQTLRNAYMDSAGHNAKLNDQRSEKIFLAFRFILAAAASAFVAFAFFYIGGLDKQDNPKSIEVKIVQPFIIEGEVSARQAKPAASATPAVPVHQGGQEAEHAPPSESTK